MKYTVFYEDTNSPNNPGSQVSDHFESYAEALIFALNLVKISGFINVYILDTATGKIKNLP